MCGFNQTAGAAERVGFIACMDAATGSAPTIATPCCVDGVEYAALLACYNGDEGYALLSAAAAKFNAFNASLLPGFAVMPTMRVGEVVVPEPYAGGITQQICHAGSTAPICDRRDDATLSLAR